mgnify:CR=1 FL=1
MRKSPKFSPEVQERAVRMVFDAKDQYPSQWAAIESIAGKIGCTGETLRKWVRQGERDSGARPGPTTGEHHEAPLAHKIGVQAVCEGNLGDRRARLVAGGQNLGLELITVAAPTTGVGMHRCPLTK